jgi:hypothetical protein
MHIPELADEMTVDEYLKQGEYWHSRGYSTDGCSFIGWLMNEKYIRACWAHDYGRAGLIDLDDDDQSTNDNMFRNALRSLGMPNWQTNIIFWFTRTQGWVRDKTGIPATTFVAFTVFAIMIVVGVWMNRADAAQYNMIQKWVWPTERETCAQLMCGLRSS